VNAHIGYQLELGNRDYRKLRKGKSVLVFRLTPKPSPGKVGLNEATGFEFPSASIAFRIFSLSGLKPVLLML
jgi:hypothetical protein